MLRLDAKFLVQRAHLTCPATVWRYVEGACTKSAADLVMLDLEDSIPRGDDDLLATGRENTVRAFNELDWGTRLRFFRPRGRELDPTFEDVCFVIRGAGRRVEGVIYPKVDNSEEVRRLDQKLVELEDELELEHGYFKIELLIESVIAEQNAFAIAQASSRLVGLVFGDYDYWSSLAMSAVEYRRDHPLVEEARRRVVKAAASVGVPAIAGMTLAFPTRDKSEAERQAALDECRQDAEHARELGFDGKWTGIPLQSEIVQRVFRLPVQAIEAAIAAVRRYREAERRGLGATTIDGSMADRATDRMHRVTLARARAQGLLDEETARELGLDETE
jgi:citrate lyase subunit beta/citryl-CoA lyase